MTLPRFRHIMPASLDEALDLLSEKGTKGRVKAGGTDLMVAMKHRTVVPEALINIRGLEALNFIRSDPDGAMVIGSLTTLNTLAQSDPVARKFPALAAAAGKVASVQIRNVGTLGGNVCLDTRCWYYNQSDQWRRSIPTCYKLGGDRCLVIKNSDRCNAVFLADTVPVLIAHDAKVKLVKKNGERTIPITDFYNRSGHPPNRKSPEELLTEIHIPVVPENTVSLFFKDAPRAVVDFALTNLAIRVTFQDHDGVCKDAGIAVGGITSFPVRSASGENALKGEKITEALMDEVAELVVKDSAPISPIWVSPRVRRQTIGVFVRRGLKAALARNRNI